MVHSPTAEIRNKSFYSILNNSMLKKSIIIELETHIRVILNTKIIERLMPCKQQILYSEALNVVFELPY